jgi:hypothetical protein
VNNPHLDIPLTQKPLCFIGGSTWFPFDNGIEERIVGDRLNYRWPRFMLLISGPYIVGPAWRNSHSLGILRRDGNQNQKFSSCSLQTLRMRQANPKSWPFGKKIKQLFLTLTPPGAARMPFGEDSITIKSQSRSS